jgi:multiple sugar transport system ATP-binding protein
MIYVTHDQMEAMTMADRIAVMSNGVVQQLGTPDEIYDQPANMFVAGFVGSPAMNFLHGQVVSDAGAHTVRGDDWEIPLNAANAARARNSASGQVHVGIRHAALSVLPSTDSRGVPARIYTVEPTGDVTFVHAWLGKHLLVASAEGRYRANADDPVRLDFDQDRLYLFDAESRQAL